jgi:phage terminase large subunit-like protein
VVIDEAYNLTAESMAAVLPTLAARPNPQIWYTSSAGMVASEQLAHIRDRGLKGGDPSLAYFEWSAPDGADLDDREAWAQANPSLGYRSRSRSSSTERAALPAEQFGRERLGLWADRDRDKPAIDPAVWATLADPQAERGDSPVFAVSTAPDRSWSAVAVAWQRPDGTPQVMLADYRPDATWVAARVEELRNRWRSPVLCDTASRGLVVDAEEPSQAEQAKAHNALSDAVLAGAIHHGNEPAMNTAVRGARWKPSGDTRVLDRKGSTDISPLVAAALAVHGLSATRPSVYESRPLLTL